jgi:hypothetical protein
MQGVRNSFKIPPKTDDGGGVGIASNNSCSGHKVSLPWSLFSTVVLDTTSGGPEG